MNVIVDADVLIGVLDPLDAHHDEARAFFRQARERGDTLLLSLINLTEILIAQTATAEQLTAVRNRLLTLGVASHVPTETIAVDAARRRARHRISLPDAYLLATARQTGGVIATFDERLRRAATAEGIALAIQG